MSKTRIFLSHATPEDNAFTQWLAAKLRLAGYDVWCDFDGLKGGDLFWEKIEAIIRHESIRLIAVASPVSYTKDGVKSEWALAATVEKQTPGFIIPVRVGNFDYSQLPIHLHQKNVIDFDAGWHFGLAKLLDTLATSSIPRQTASQAPHALSILREGQGAKICLANSDETLESNWLALEELPPAVEMCRILSSHRKIEVTERNRGLPWFEIGDRIGSFAKRGDIRRAFGPQVPLKEAEACLTEEFLRGNVSIGTRVATKDAQNRVSYLVRQAWEILAESRGFAPYSMANRVNAWYVPLGLLPMNKAVFIDIDGRSRRRQLAGTSEKHKVNWHYAITAFPVLSSPRRMELHSHVVFSNPDGSLVELSRMHRLRRGFCKSWWNDRWLGFLHSYLAVLAGDNDYIEVPVGSGRAIRVSSTPMRFVSPISLIDLASAPADEDVELGELVDDTDTSDLPEEGN